MEDNIELEKIWYDDNLIQLKIVCSSAIINVQAKIYVSNSLIDDLIHQLKSFIDGQINEGLWANETRGNDSPTCFSLRFLRKDNRGHVLIEVFLELDDGGNLEVHNCCFFIETEYGLLSSFCQKLSSLKDRVIGLKVVLN